MVIRALILTVCLTTGLNAIIALLMARRTRVAGVKEWAIGAAIVSFGVLLLGLRGEIHDFFSIVIANGVILAGYAVIWDGMRRFIGHESSVGYMLIAVGVVGVSCVGMYYYAFIDPAFSLRTIIATSGILFFSAMIANTLLLKSRGGGVVTVTGALYSLNALVGAFRLMQPVISPENVPFLNSGMVTYWFFVFNVAFSIAVVWGQVLMVRNEMSGPFGRPPISNLFFSSDPI